MGYRIILKERTIKTMTTMEQLDRVFPRDNFQWRIEKKGGLMIAANTEGGWIAIWCRLITKEQIEIYHINASRSFYSRNGNYFLDRIIELCQSNNGNLCMGTKEPETGGGSLTIIYQGKVIHGVFTKDFNHKQHSLSIWADEYTK